MIRHACIGKSNWSQLLSMIILVCLLYVSWMVVDSRSQFWKLPQTCDVTGGTLANKQQERVNSISISLSSAVIQSHAFHKRSHRTRTQW